MRTTALAVHIAAGVLGIAFGFVALYAAKGAGLHRKSGIVFVYAMLTMAMLGAGMSAIWGRARTSNIPVGLLTAYLVTTALLTVRPPASGSRWKDVGLMLVALAVCLSLFTSGVEAASSPNGQLNGIPVPPFFIFGLIALLASVGDLRLIRSGGVRTVRGRPRLVRHLWRMCTALLIAAFSFFLGQSQVFPKPIRIVPLLALPPLAALVTMVYWLSRVRGRRFSVHAVMGAPAALSDYPV